MITPTNWSESWSYRLGDSCASHLDCLHHGQALATYAKVKSLVKTHHASLLESKRKYWKQRNTVRWITLGDENTSFFQAMATHSHTRKYIGSLVTSEDIIVTDHEQKAGILWNAFKARLGTSEFQGISYDLESLLHRHDLEFLTEDFSDTETTNVIKEKPNSHAPGPDGFNGLFIKKCWSIIKADFLRFVNEFFRNVIDVSCLNSSHIVLVPKKPNPATVDDYRPISLMNYSLKCITKLMSFRLQSVFPQLVHQNQYEFIKGRTIQDCLSFSISTYLPPLQKRSCYSETRL